MATNFRSTHCADLHAVKLRMYHSGTQGDLEEENRQLRLAKQALEASNLAHLARLQAHARTHARTHALRQASTHTLKASQPSRARASVFAAKSCLLLMLDYCTHLVLPVSLSYLKII